MCMGQSQTGGNLLLTGQGDSKIHSNSRHLGQSPTGLSQATQRLLVAEVRGPDSSHFSPRSFVMSLRQSLAGLGRHLKLMYT